MENATVVIVIDRKYELDLNYHILNRKRIEDSAIGFNAIKYIISINNEADVTDLVDVYNSEIVIKCEGNDEYELLSTTIDAIYTIDKDLICERVYIVNDMNKPSSGNRTIFDASLPKGFLYLENDDDNDLGYKCSSLYTDKYLLSELRGVQGYIESNKIGIYQKSVIEVPNYKNKSMNELLIRKFVFLITKKLDRFDSNFINKLSRKFKKLYLMPLILSENQGEANSIFIKNKLNEKQMKKYLFKLFIYEKSLRSKLIFLNQCDVESLQ